MPCLKAFKTNPLQVNVFLFTSFICVGESGFKISMDKALCLREVLNANIPI